MIKLPSVGFIKTVLLKLYAAFVFFVNEKLKKFTQNFINKRVFIFNK